MTIDDISLKAANDYYDYEAKRDRYLGSRDVLQSIIKFAIQKDDRFGRLAGAVQAHYGNMDGEAVTNLSKFIEELKK